MGQDERNHEWRKTNMTSMDVTKFKDGKAIEHWVYMDPNELIKMMAPPPLLRHRWLKRPTLLKINGDTWHNGSVFSTG